MFRIFSHQWTVSISLSYPFRHASLTVADSIMLGFEHARFKLTRDCCCSSSSSSWVAFDDFVFRLRRLRRLRPLPLIMAGSRTSTGGSADDEQWMDFGSVGFEMTFESFDDTTVFDCSSVDVAGLNAYFWSTSSTHFSTESRMRSSRAWIHSGEHITYFFIFFLFFVNTILNSQMNK